MSLPKRPFTTSSLTSSLKSTLASQPLLNNLTNIDKLSSQASSLAQKTPFFGTINQQFQQHHQQQDQSEPKRYSGDSANSTFVQTNVTTGGNIGSIGSAERISSSNRGDDMNRDVHKLNDGSGIRAPMANAPDVDMSHLTEEERAMIQSVMAKAEMADMGLPVDTSSPSSTNLPSSTSQALTQQRDQQRQQQQLRQQQQQQQLQLQQQEQHRQQQQQQQQQHYSVQQQPQAVITELTGSGSQPIQQQQSMQSNLSQNDNTQQTVQRPGVGLSQQTIGINNPSGSMYVPQRSEQPNIMTVDQVKQQDPSMIMNTQSGQYHPSTNAISNISNFGPSASPMQPIQPQNSLLFNTSSIAGSSNVDACYQNNFVDTNPQNASSSMNNPTQSNYFQVFDDQNNVGNLGSYEMPQQSQLSNQPIVDMPHSQASPYECINQNIPPQVVQFSSDPTTQMINNQKQYDQSFDSQYPVPQIDSQMDYNRPQLAGLAPQNIVRQSHASALSRQQPKYVSASDMDYEHALSDRDQRQVKSRHAGNQGVKSMSRHESMETTRRSARKSRNRDALELQAYDLAQRSSSGASHKSRQLPQPGCSNNHGNAREQSIEPNLLSSGGYIHEDRSSRRSRVTRRSPVRQTEKVRAASKGKLDKKIAHESSCPTESDLDDDPQTESESDNKKSRRSADVTHPKSIQNGEEEDPADKETADKKANIVDQSDRSEQSLKLLSELKLTEQANQVMEQQQLLIKQSQELIKLQQAQLEQQAEINKTLSEAERDKRQSGQRNDIEMKQSDRSEREQDIQGVDNDRVGSKFDAGRNTGHEKSLTTEPKVEHRDDDGKAHEAIASKSRLDNDSDVDRKRKSRDPTRDVDSTSDLDSNWRSGRNHETARSARAKSPPNPRVRSMSALTRKRIRDSNQSPTDTTDSDIDLMSQTSSRHDRTKSLAKSSKLVMRIRREPKGLPPSPLPVAAAIQLHQMQQKHRNQNILTNQLNSRTNQLRSRSVTNSPNHMLDRMMSGYMTDTQQHARPSSPDTMSEYGGQRRRKRLPEPPANVVPITPSMVRRMVQANRAASISSARLFNIHTNSSILPPSSMIKTSIFRNELDRRPSLNMDYKPSIDVGEPVRYGSSSFLSNIPSTSDTRQTLLGSPHYPASDALSSDSRLYNDRHKLGGYKDDCDHILRPEQISDVKDTPELDKLISNLDEYYLLDGPMNQSASSTRVPYPVASSFKPDSQYESSIKSRSPISSYSGVRLASDYPITTLSKPSNASPSYLSDPSDSLLARQSSDFAQVRAIDQGHNNQAYHRQISRLNDLNSVGHYTPTAYTTDHSYPLSTSYETQKYHPARQPIGSYFDDTLGVQPRTNASTSSAHDYQTQPSAISHSLISNEMRAPYGAAMRELNSPRCPAMQSRDRSMLSYSQPAYIDDRDRINYPSDDNQRDVHIGRASRFLENQDLRPSTNRYTNHLSPITKDDIINNGPKYDSIGYRFRTENQNKYVTEPRTPIECLQSRYPYPYKRILLSKNPKDRLGNGIGVKILGGHPLPNIYDKVNKCILTSGAFVTEVFHSSRVYFMDEMHEGDQVVEWNGVNLCNRGDEEVQQILLSQFSDEEVEIIYLSRQKFKDAYGADLNIDPRLLHPDSAYDVGNGTYDIYAAMNKPNSYNIHGHQVNEPFKRSIRRKLSLSSISHMWSK